jgi:hypothetical protein
VIHIPASSRDKGRPVEKPPVQNTAERGRGRSESTVNQLLREMQGADNSEGFVADRMELRRASPDYFGFS